MKGQSLPVRPAIHFVQQRPPEANPDEGVWGYTKYGRLANFAPEDTAELRAALVGELERLDRCPKLLASFIRNAAVPIRLHL
jgi:hypothetical protein